MLIRSWSARLMARHMHPMSYFFTVRMHVWLGATYSLCPKKNVILGILVQIIKGGQMTSIAPIYLPY
jgi:hypothetical protein